MKAYIKLILILLIVGFCFIETAQAADAVIADAPSSYEVTIEKLRLYDPEKEVWVTVAEGGLLVDIASAGAGQDITDYINWAQIPDGHYTRVEATLDKNIRMLTSKGRSKVGMEEQDCTREFILPNIVTIKNGIRPDVRVRFEVRAYPQEPIVTIELL